MVINSFLIISNEIVNIEAVTDKCVNQAITDTEIYFVKQETVINAITLIVLCNNIKQLLFIFF